MKEKKKTKEIQILSVNVYWEKAQFAESATVCILASFSEFQLLYNAFQNQVWLCHLPFHPLGLSSTLKVLGCSNEPPPANLHDGLIATHRWRSFSCSVLLVWGRERRRQPLKNAMLYVLIVKREMYGSCLR